MISEEKFKSLVEDVKIDLDLHFFDSHQIQIRKMGDEMTLSLADRSYFNVEARRAFPLTRKNNFITFFDLNEKEIGMIQDVRQLPVEMRDLLESELEKRYFTARIRKVRGMKEEFGLFHLVVDTDKGPRDFFLRNLRDNVLRLPPQRIILTDIHGNRFEIRNVSRLDAKSLATIAKII